MVFLVVQKKEYFAQLNFKISNGFFCICASRDAQKKSCSLFSAGIGTLGHGVVNVTGEVVALQNSSKVCQSHPKVLDPQLLHHIMNNDLPETPQMWQSSTYEGFHGRRQRLFQVKK